MTSTNHESVLSMRGIETRFGSQTVHSGIDLEFRRGEVTALIGGSGCGKSVLLKEAVGLLRPSEGQVTLFGYDIWTISDEELMALRNRCGVLFQNGALFSGLTVLQNVSVPLIEQTDLEPQIIENVALLQLALSGLSSEAAPKFPSELSGGMVKRAALARALALSPEVLFLDEPTSGLDPINARSFDNLVRTLCDSLGLCIILVTHDLDTLEGMVDRIVVLGGGKVVADGSLEEVKAHPDTWIQQYFGSRVKGL